VPAIARLAPASLLWPTRGQIVREFGPQPSGARNDGIDIVATEGSPVVAVEDGTVTYAGSDLPGYGNMLLVTHRGGYISVYAHNQLLLAPVGTKVGRGQQIATVGQWGENGEARLHFQLRAGERPVDPEPLFEPQPTMMASLAAGEPPLGAR
jgi:septal ring factor EnvC (AmiA/AmiB activator)